MKDKQLNKKLVLNKETIANMELPIVELAKIHGGIQPVEPEWEYTINYPISCRTRDNCATEFPVCR